MKPIVVVIDSGIDSKIVNNVTMDVLKKGEEDKCGHGTACAMIIKSIAPKVDIISIPLLDENIEATSIELEKALSFCQEIDCNIINLSLSVTNLLEKFEQYNFESPHKSFIVNMLYIKSIKGFDIFIENGDKIPLAQKRAVEFKNIFNDFLQETFDRI